MRGMQVKVHFKWYVGTRVVPGDGKPPSFYFECRFIACANPRSALRAAFSRPLSKVVLTRESGSAATSVLWIQPLFVNIHGEYFLQFINDLRRITVTYASIFFPRF